MGEGQVESHHAYFHHNSGAGAGPSPAAFGRSGGTGTGTGYSAAASRGGRGGSTGSSYGGPLHVPASVPGAAYVHQRGGRHQPVLPAPSLKRPLSQSSSRAAAETAPIATDSWSVPVGGSQRAHRGKATGDISCAPVGPAMDARTGERFILVSSLPDEFSAIEV